MKREIGFYIAGFVDGEGIFNVSIRQRIDYVSKLKISLCFNVSQKDKVILTLLKRHIGCGTLRQRKDGIWYYEVNSFHDIGTKVIPFFKRFTFLSAKKRKDFSKFCQIAEKVRKGEHLTDKGIRKIISLRNQMNSGGNRKHSDEEILKILQESSETTRQTLHKQEGMR
jgi:hypothetical protein